MEDIITPADLEPQVDPEHKYDQYQAHVLLAARLIEAHPELPAPDANRIDVHYRASDKGNFKEIRQALGGKWDKKSDHWLYPNGVYLNQVMELDGWPINVVIFPPYGTCKKVQVGTKPQKVRRVVSEAVTEEVEEEVPVYEIQCPDLLTLDDDDT